MTYTRLLLGLAFCFASATFAAPVLADPGSLYQISTRQALRAGGFDGETTVGELKKHGDLGFGILNALDGVLIGLEGVFYQVAADGKVTEVKDSRKIPYAAATRFKTDRLLKLEQIDDLEQLEARLCDLLPTPNIFYAVLVEGRFDLVKTSSLSGQTKPYPPFKDVLAQQSVFKLSDVEGSLIGFKYPCLAKGLGGPGFVWSFLAKDRQSGGRVLECSFSGLTAKIENISLFTLKLPSDSTFYGLDILKSDQPEESREETDQSQP